MEMEMETLKNGDRHEKWKHGEMEKWRNRDIKT
jgi:hypothetical protein